MQQTKLDRWLQTRFVNETLVMTVREPPLVPKGIKVKDLPKTINSRFLFQMVIRDPKDLDAAIAELKKQSQTFTTRVRQRTGVAKFLFAHESGKSFTISFVSAILFASSMFSLVIFFPDILIEYWHTFVTPALEQFKDTAVETWNNVKDMIGWGSNTEQPTGDAPQTTIQKTPGSSR